MPDLGYVGSVLFYGGVLTVSCLDGPQVGRFNRKNLINSPKWSIMCVMYPSHFVVEKNLLKKKKEPNKNEFLTFNQQILLYHVQKKIFDCDCAELSASYADSIFRTT